MNAQRRLVLTALASAGLVAATGPAFAKKQEHHSGKDLLGEKIKHGGKHVLHKKGPHTVAVDVKDGKIAGMTVTHDTKGNVPVKKYKANKKMAAMDYKSNNNMAVTDGSRIDGLHLVAYNELAQAYSTGVTYIGYAYIDDYGDEQVYWWPYEMIYDPWSGTTEYVPYA